MSSLIRAGLRNPAMVSVKDHSRARGSRGQDERTPASLDNYYLTVDPRLKLATMVQFLRVGIDQSEHRILLLLTNKITIFLLLIG